MAVERDRTELGVHAVADLAPDDAVHHPLLIVPVGACEQHGPHLPLATDSIIAEALSRELVGRLGPQVGVTIRQALIAPTLAVTASGEHAGFPGTLSIGTDVMRSVVVELVRSARWAAGVVLVNGHGGNHAAITAAVTQLTDEGHHVLAWWPSLDPTTARAAGLETPQADLHAGHVETSLLLALAPDLVHTERAVPGPSPTIAELRAHGVQALSPNGVLGDPTTADRRSGDVIFGALVHSLARATIAWLGEP